MEPIDPRVHVAFKKIFGVEENKDLLISLVNSIVGKEDQVTDVTLLNPYNLRNFAKEKLSILDIKAKGAEGKRYNIEIQITDDADYDKRALYYWGKMYTEQLKVSQDYSTLSKAIGIHILNFTSIPEVTKYHNVFRITEKETGLVYFKDLELHTIELKKFSKDTHAELSDIVALIKNSLDMWVAFLTRRDLLKKDNLPSKLDDPALKKALGVLDVMDFGDEEREAYESHLKWLRLEASTLKKYEAKGLAEGERIGLEKGERIGLEKGERIGLEKGERIGDDKRALKVAKELIIDGMPLEKISRIAELSSEIVIKLAQEISKESKEKADDSYPPSS